VANSYKHISLLCFGVNYGRKFFYSVGPNVIKKIYGRNLRSFHNKLVFVFDKSYHPCLMFVGKAVAYSRVEQFFTWVGSLPFLQTLD
jgi:hypothetical protein